MGLKNLLVVLTAVTETIKLNKTKDSHKVFKPTLNYDIIQTVKYIKILIHFTNLKTLKKQIIKLKTLQNINLDTLASI